MDRCPVAAARYHGLPARTRAPTGCRMRFRCGYPSMNNVLAEKENANTIRLTSAKWTAPVDDETVLKLADAFERRGGGFAMRGKKSRQGDPPPSRSAQRPNPAMP